MFSFVLAVSYIFVLWLKSYLANSYRKNFKHLPYDGSLSDVAIMTPILSGDPELKSVLERNLSLHKDIHFYWLIDKNDEPAKAIAQEIQDNNPESKIHLQYFDQAPEKINPKAFKLDLALQDCSQNIIVVLDDDTLLPFYSLSTMLGALRYANIATGLPQYREGKNWQSSLLASFVNNNAALTYLSVLPLIQAITLNGMCYAFKKDYLQELGGYKAILHHLTDDLAVAELVLKNGGSICQTPEVQWVGTSVENTTAYIKQMQRWYVFAKLLYLNKPFKIQCLMNALYGLPPLLLITLCICVVLSASAMQTILLGLVLLVRHVFIQWHCRESRFFSGLRFFVSCLSELLQPFHFLHALIDNRIRWRSRWYKVYSNDHFENV